MSERFTPFPKIPRLLKPIVITEKIDGTNGAVRVVPVGGTDQPYAGGVRAGEYMVYAQSRTRDIPLAPLGMDDLDYRKRDNHGFGAWVREHAEALAVTLGPGVHFGEWWGYKINRGYNCENGDKRFSLFNVERWGIFSDPEYAPDIPGLGAVPVLYEGEFDTMAIEGTLDTLRMLGSSAAPGYMTPEGVVIYHKASGALFKVTYARSPKVLAGRVVETSPQALSAAA